MRMVCPSDGDDLVAASRDHDGRPADLGHWVYDSGHNDDGRGFNEIHPVTFAAKWRKDFGGNVILLKKRWAGAVADARSQATLESQSLPQNQWHVHPMLDGCQPVIIV